MFYATTTKNCLPKKNVCLSVCVCVTSHSYLGTYVLTPYVYSDILTRCHVTDINHVLTRCHVTEINYVDRGAAARAPLQYKRMNASLKSCFMEMAPFTAVFTMK